MSRSRVRKGQEFNNRIKIELLREPQPGCGLSFVGRQSELPMQSLKVGTPHTTIILSEELFAGLHLTQLWEQVLTLLFSYPCFRLSASKSETSCIWHCTPWASSMRRWGRTGTTLLKSKWTTSRQGNMKVDFFPWESIFQRNANIIQERRELDKNQDVTGIRSPLRRTEYHALFFHGLQRKWESHHQIYGEHANI